MPFDGTQLNRTVQLLLSAKSRLEKDGWCQCELHADSGAHCLWGSFEFKDREEMIEINHILEHTIRLKSGFRFDVPQWNDASNRTKEEVLALLDKAVELATI